MSGLGNLGRKASEFLNSPRAQEHLKSQKAEDLSDKILGGAAGIANKITGGKHADKIEKARDAADRKIGTDGTPGHVDTTPNPAATHNPATHDPDGTPRVP